MKRKKYLEKFLDLDEMKANIVHVNHVAFFKGSYISHKFEDLLIMMNRIKWFGVSALALSGACLIALILIILF